LIGYMSAESDLDINATRKLVKCPCIRNDGLQIIMLVTSKGNIVVCTI